jgi:hypothetical protein
MYRLYSVKSKGLFLSVSPYSSAMILSPYIQSYRKCKDSLVYRRASFTLSYSFIITAVAYFDMIKRFFLFLLCRIFYHPFKNCLKLASRLLSSFNSL